MTSTWERLADLPLRIDDYALEPLRMNVSSGFERLSTVVHLRGDGVEGVGEDVTYEADEQEAAWASGPSLPLAGELDDRSFAEHAGALDLFGGRDLERDVYRRYRRWAYESAALDLALNQAGLPLHEALGREPRPMTFVVSLRLGEPRIDGAAAAAAGDLPVAALQARPDAELDRRGHRGSGRDRRRRQRRLQGPLRGRRRGRRRRPRPVRARRRGVPRRVVSRTRA